MRGNLTSICRQQRGGYNCAQPQSKGARFRPSLKSLLPRKSPHILTNILARAPNPRTQLTPSLRQGCRPIAQPFLPCGRANKQCEYADFFEYNFNIIRPLPSNRKTQGPLFVAWLHLHDLESLVAPPESWLWLASYWSPANDEEASQY